MYKLEFTLKQHTPLIHFQHDQEGATLRASEVKPKLDQFIMNKLTKIPSLSKHYNIALKFGDAMREKKSLYMLRFQSHGELKYFLPLALEPNTKNNNGRHQKLESEIREKLKFSVQILAPSPYFANSDKYVFIQNSNDLDYERTKFDELKFAILQNSEISGIVVSPEKDVLNCIQDILPYFIACENFGSRQDKGFGCFSITHFNGIKYNFCHIDLLKAVYTVVYEKSIFNKWYETITKDYKLLKSGRGRKEEGGYAKSKLFLHFAEMKPKIGWEKRFLKQQLNGKIIDSRKFLLKKDTDLRSVTDPIDISYKQNWIDSIPADYKYIRALLGLAEQIEFAAIPENLIVKIDNDIIERFKSPIIFKVYNNTIYLCANEFEKNHKIFDSQFSMKYFPKKSKRPKSNIASPPCVPSNFSILNFLDFALLNDKISPNNEKIKGYSIK